MNENKITPQGELVQKELTVRIPLSNIAIADLSSHHHFEKILKNNPECAVAWIENSFTEMPKGMYKAVIYDVFDN